MAELIAGGWLTFMSGMCATMVSAGGYAKWPRLTSWLGGALIGMSVLQGIMS